MRLLAQATYSRFLSGCSGNVLELQRGLIQYGHLPPGQDDGIYGPRTRQAQVRLLDEVWPYTEIGRSSPYTDVSYKLRRGRYAKGPDMRPQVLALHWPAMVVDADGLGQHWEKTRDRSSNGAVDEHGYVSFAPPHWRTWHGTWMNEYSYGIDIMQPVQTKHLTHRTWKARLIADTIEVGPNRTRRGERTIVRIHPRIAKRACASVSVLCEVCDIPPVVPREWDGTVRHDVVFPDSKALGDWRGVLGHHHWDSGKWDIACWWADLFDGGSLGSPEAL